LHYRFSYSWQYNPAAGETGFRVFVLQAGFSISQ
jgi:hypothetical protein